MKKIIFAIITLLLSSSAYSYPLNINELDKEHKLPPTVEEFKYWYGDVDHGYLIYLGKKNIAGFETELHLHFVSKKISKAIIILGPAGIDSHDCLRRYKEALDLLNKKYGHFVYQKTIKDPLVDDLVSFSVCTPVKIGLYTVETYWKTKGFRIIATLLGDDEGIYIEIEYIFTNRLPVNNLKKIL